MSHNQFGTPGVKTARATGDFPFIIKNPEYADGGVLVDATFTRDHQNTGDPDVLRPGMVLRQLASGLYAPWLLGLTSVDYTTGTELTVPLATAEMIVKAIGTSGVFSLTGHPGTATALVDVDTEVVTFSAVNTATGVITVSAITLDYDAGSFITVTVPKVLGGTGGVASPGLAFVIIDKPDGLKITDIDNVDMDAQLAQAAIGGHVDMSQLVNVPTLSFCVEVLAENLRDATRFMFDNLHE